MSVPLLATKLYVPAVRSERVVRQRLIDRLDEGLGRKLTLVSAPAGFGKTTLIAEWARRIDRPVLWFSLDEDDNDLTRFCLYLSAALRQVDEDLGQAMYELVQAPDVLPVETLLTVILDRIATIQASFILVLDDYYVIHEGGIHRAVKFLVTHLPPTVHLVISTREDPPLPLSRMHVLGQITEIRAGHLRFDRQEVAAFLNDVMALNLTSEEIGLLQERTEGWIAGLQLAAIALLAPYTQARANREAFIRAFAGDERHVVDYLVEEVVSHQPAEIQDFLLHTAILDRLCAPLCDAVAFNNTDALPGKSRDILNHLDEANLFIVPLDNRRGWYRYHHLFADLLRYRLHQMKAECVPVLHRRASEWYERKGFTVEAVHHAFAAHDAARIVHLFRQHSLALLDYDTLNTLAVWFDKVPDAMSAVHPWLGIFKAWVRSYTTGSFDAIELLLQASENNLADLPNAEVRHLRGHIHALRAYIAQHRGEKRLSKQLARQALDCLPPHDLVARGFAMYMVGSADFWLGELGAATQTLTEAITVHRAAGDSHVSMITSCVLAELQVAQGRLHDAVKTYSDALLFSERHAAEETRKRLPFQGGLMTGLASVLAEQNDMESAALTLQKGIDLCRQRGQTDVLLVSYTDATRTLLAFGNLDAARQALDHAIRLAHGIAPWPLERVEALGVRLWLAEGNLTAAARWAQARGLRVEDDFSFQRQGIYLAYARLLIAQGRAHDALSVLARHLRLVEVAGATGFVIENLTLQALALRACGATGQAIAVLARALELAEPERYVHTFVGAGAPMASMLYEAATCGIAPVYVSRLLAAFPDAEEPVSPTICAPEGVEPLSEREREVLSLLAEGCSNQAVAERLVITLNTVKSHTWNIYRKFGVHNRTQAIAKARMFGLIDRN